MDLRKTFIPNAGVVGCPGSMLQRGRRKKCGGKTQCTTVSTGLQNRYKNQVQRPDSAYPAWLRMCASNTSDFGCLLALLTHKLLSCDSLDGCKNLHTLGFERTKSHQAAPWDHGEKKRISQRCRTAFAAFLFRRHRMCSAFRRALNKDVEPETGNTYDREGPKRNVTKSPLT